MRSPTKPDGSHFIIYHLVSDQIVLRILHLALPCPELSNVHKLRYQIIVIGKTAMLNVPETDLIIVFLNDCRTSGVAYVLVLPSCGALHNPPDGDHGVYIPISFISSDP